MSDVIVCEAELTEEQIDKALFGVDVSVMLERARLLEMHAMFLPPEVISGTVDERADKVWSLARRQLAGEAMRRASRGYSPSEIDAALRSRVDVLLRRGAE